MHSKIMSPVFCHIFPQSEGQLGDKNLHPGPQEWTSLQKTQN